MPNTIQITSAQLIIALISAAGIGALVSSLITFLSQWRERKSRREETLLKAAMDLAEWRLSLAMKNAENLEIPQTRMLDKVVYTEQYYRLLDQLMKDGKLP